MKTKLLTCCTALCMALQLLAVNDFSVNGINYTKLGGDSVEVGTNAGYSGTVSIPETVSNSNKTYRVVAIGNDAFSGCYGVTSVSLPNSITEIGSWAFRNCRMTHISIPNSVITIKNSAYRDCINLTSIIIGDNVRHIGDDAFDYCTSLASVTIGNNVSYIGSQAFYDCWALTSFDLPNSVIYTGEDVLKNTGITTPIYNTKLFVYLPSNYVGAYSIADGISTIAEGACKECKSLTSVSFPSSLHKLSLNAFKGCTNISSIIIPANVDTIERGCFVGCVDITDVYINAVNPPFVAYSDWSDDYKSFSSNPTIHLACGVDSIAYRNNGYWNNYNLEFPVPNYTLILSADETQGTIQTIKALACNNNTAIIYAHANVGYHFTSWSDGNIDNPRTIIMTQDKTLHANFAVSLYTFAATTEDEVKGTVAANNGSYQYGTEITMIATPADHYYFDHWKIEQEKTSESSIIAKFSVPDSWQNTYAWIWETGGYGHWETLPQENGWYVYRTNADNMHILLAKDQSYGEKTEDLDLTESACYTITSNGSMYYSDVTKSYDCINPDDYTPQLDTVTTTVTENPYTLTLTTNTKATAVFLKEKHLVNLTCTNGQITCDGSYPWDSYNELIEHGNTINATVIPYDGYIFQQWEDGNTDNPRAFIVNDKITMQATCIRNQSVLTLSTSDDEAGRVFGSGSYVRYTTVQIFAIPNSGYDFVGWSDNNTTNPRLLYLTESEITLTANFEVTSAAQYIVNVSAQNPQQGSASATNYVRLDAIPSDGCTFVGWSDGSTENPRYMELNTDIILQAIFDGTPEGVENPSTAPKGSIRKVIVNGSLLIINDGKTYDSLGFELK